MDEDGVALVVFLAIVLISLFFFTLYVIKSDRKKPCIVSEVGDDNDIDSTPTSAKEDGKYQILYKIISPEIAPMLEFVGQELSRHAKNLQHGQTPEILESSKANIIHHLKWFLANEGNGFTSNLSPDIIAEMINDTLNQYNKDILRLAKEAFDDYNAKINELVTDKLKTQSASLAFEAIDQMRMFADTKANNYTEITKSLNDLHYRVEEIFSNLYTTKITKYLIHNY